MRRRGRHARGTVTITTAQAVTVLQALADAEEYRRESASGWCADCEYSPAGLCETHADDFDAADVYAGLARQLQEGEQ